MLKLGQDTKNEILKGVNRVAEAVKKTAGQQGKFALIENNLGLPPHPTKDGVTVLNSIYGSNQYEELGVQLLKQAANKTAEITGDGSTATTILAQALINRLFEHDYASHVDLIKGMNVGLEEVNFHLDNFKKSVGDKEMIEIATVSANGDIEIGQKVAEIYKKVGLDSTIEVKEGYSTETEVVYTEGLRLDRGWAFPHFCTDFDKGIAEFENCYLLLYNSKINTLADITKPLIKAREDRKAIVIIADDAEEPVVSSLLNMKRKGELQVLMCVSPEYGELREKVLDDLSFVTGASVYSERFKDEIVLGEVKKFTAYRDKSILVVKDENKLTERVDELSKQVEFAEKEVQKRLKNRISNLKSSIVEINVGGITDLEIKEKKDRIDDAVPALRNALEEGYIAGGGATLYHISKIMKSNLKGSELTGYNVLKEAIKEPLKTIIGNAGLTLSPFVWKENQIKSGKLNEYGIGVNVKTKKVENMFEAGIIDPVKITKTALQNAVSVASTALSTDVLILSKNSL